VLDTSSLAREGEVARSSSKVGGPYVTTKARRVFASAERKSELDQKFQLKTAAQVTEARFHEQRAHEDRAVGELPR
jgi:hypothetical protein